MKSEGENEVNSFFFALTLWPMSNFEIFATQDVQTHYTDPYDTHMDQNQTGLQTVIVHESNKQIYKIINIDKRNLL